MHQNNINQINPVTQPCMCVFDVLHMYVSVNLVTFTFKPVESVCSDAINTLYFFLKSTDRYGQWYNILRRVIFNISPLGGECHVSI